MWLANIYNIGTAHQPFSVANKVRITNIVVLVTVLVSALYTLTYVFAIKHPIVASINSFFTFAYAFTLFFNHFYAHRASKIWFFSVLMVHLFVCTNIYVTNASGFHLYYFLVPTGAFLLFDLSERKEKVTLSLISVALFLYCENTFNSTPLIELSEQLNSVIYQSVILVNMLEVILVLTIFANEIEANEYKLTQQAKTDALTGIANRHAFFEQASGLFLAAQKNKRPITIALLDFDYFKAINDKYGHFTGDLCLIEVSKVVSEQCRPQDTFARIGGEEFAIVMPDTTLQEANNLAEEIRLSIARQTIPVVGEKSFSCTASFGLATNNCDNKQLKDILVDADKALYQAKEYGRNRVYLYQETSY